MTDYHKIYLPFTDVYNMAGPDAITDMAPQENGHTNLVVVPHDFSDILQETADKQRHRVCGAKDASDFMMELSEKKGLSGENGVQIAEASPNLHVAFMDTPAGYGAMRNGHVDADSIQSLEEKVCEHFDTNEKVRFITEKTNKALRLKSRGIQVERARHLRASADNDSEGIIHGNQSLQAKLYEKDGRISRDEARDLLDRDLRLNQFIRLRGKKGYEYAKVSADRLVPTKDHTGIDHAEGMHVRMLNSSEYDMVFRIGDYRTDDILGVKPLDMEQYLSVQHGLLNQDVSLAFLTGSFGSGKTLLAYAASMLQVLSFDKDPREKMGNKRNKAGFFDTMYLLKADSDELGKDLGMLPGSMYEKLRPILQPYIDAHRETALKEKFSFYDLLKHPDGNDYFEPRDPAVQNRKVNGEAHLPPYDEAINLMHISYIRGISKRNTLFLIDEAQNFTPYQIKSIITRAGTGSKCVVMGDPDQVSNPACSEEVNGLTSAIKNYFNPEQPDKNLYSGLFKLSQNFRSQMSEDALNWRVYEG